jgi:hypothetical protein
MSNGAAGQRAVILSGPEGQGFTSSVCRRPRPLIFYRAILSRMKLAAHQGLFGSRKKGQSVVPWRPGGNPAYLGSEAENRLSRLMLLVQWLGWCRLQDSNLRPHHYE